MGPLDCAVGVDFLLVAGREVAVAPKKTIFLECDSKQNEQVRIVVRDTCMSHKPRRVEFHIFHSQRASSMIWPEESADGAKS